MNAHFSVGKGTEYCQGVTELRREDQRWHHFMGCSAGSVLMSSQVPGMRYMSRRSPLNWMLTLSNSVQRTRVCNLEDIPMQRDRRRIETLWESHDPATGIHSDGAMGLLIMSRDCGYFCGSFFGFPLFTLDSGLGEFGLQVPECSYCTGEFEGRGCGLP